MPLPHLAVYTTIHSYSGGMLFEPGSEQVVAGAMLGVCRTGDFRSHAIVIQNGLSTCPQFLALAGEAAGSAGGWFESARFRRPILTFHEGKAPYAVTCKSNTSDLRRRRRRLAEFGAPAFRVIRGGDSIAAAAQRHLELEHNGWKGRQQSSLLSSANETGFFKEMIARFSEIGAAVFAETLCGDVVIASDSAFLLGDTLNFFKLGWHQDFAKFSPSRLNTLSMIEELPASLPQIGRFDSQSRESGYMADLFPEHQIMVSGTIAATRSARLAMQVARLWRPLAHRVRRD